MKKVLLGMTLVSAITLVGCSSDAGGTAESSLSEKVSELESSIDSLKEENEKLKKQLSTNNTTQSENTTSSESTSKKEFGLGEEAILKDNQGNDIYSLKIIKATTSISPDSVATYDDSYTNLVEVVYEYKNYDYESAMLISSQFISAYDSNGLAGSNLGYMDGQTEVSSGKAAQSTIWFEMPSDPSALDSIEIDYSNDFSLGFEDTISFTVPLEH